MDFPDETTLVPDLGLGQIVVYKVDTAKPAITHMALRSRFLEEALVYVSPSMGSLYIFNELSLSVTTFEWDATNGTAKTLTTEPALSERIRLVSHLIPQPKYSSIRVVVSSILQIGDTIA